MNRDSEGRLTIESKRKMLLNAHTDETKFARQWKSDINELNDNLIEFMWDEYNALGRFRGQE